MTKFWAIRESNVSGTKFRVTSRRQVSIGKGDHLVAWKGSGKTGSFVWQSVVDEVLQPVGETGERRVFQFRISSPQKIEDGRSLEELAYSLTKIRRSRSPGLHFRQIYTSLSAHDFETIVNGRVFWSRTALGEFLTRTPDPVFKMFLNRLALTNPTLLIDGSFSEVWQAYCDIVIGELVSAHHLLDSTQESFKSISLAAEGGVFEQIYLSDDDSPNIRDRLALQTQRLSRLAEDLEVHDSQISLVAQVDDQIRTSDFESEYEELFRSTHWLEIRNY